jgi:hypothetical protein
VKDAEKKYNGKFVQIVDFLYESDEQEDVRFLDENAGVCRGTLIGTLWH